MILHGFYWATDWMLSFDIFGCFYSLSSLILFLDFWNGKKQREELQEANTSSVTFFFYFRQFLGCSSQQLKLQIESFSNSGYNLTSIIEN